MAPSYDCASSILLCTEDNDSVLSFDDEEHTEERCGKVSRWVPGSKRCDLYADFLLDLPLQSEECVRMLVGRESEHMARVDYAERLLSGALELSIRSDAIDWILKAHGHYNFGPLSAYLAVNYLDRFLSAYELPQGKAWMTQLLSVACLSLAAKMEETEVPPILDLQVAEAKYVFEARTIQRMELLVLSTLKWRMQVVTPFSYIDFFLHNFSGGNSPTKLLVSRSIELILSTMRGIAFIVFRPSEIAAAIALSVFGETQVLDIETSLSCCNYVSKEDVLRCYEMILDMVMARSMSPKNVSPLASSLPHSPNGVLDAACMSYRSDDLTVGSHSSCHHTSPVSKRQKISRV